MPDDKDWCQEAVDLRQLQRDLVGGEGIIETRLGDRMVKFAKPDPGRLDDLIREADRKCAEQNGEAPRRRRWAMGVRVRPY